MSLGFWLYSESLVETLTEPDRTQWEMGRPGMRCMVKHVEFEVFVDIQIEESARKLRLRLEGTSC